MRSWKIFSQIILPSLSTYHLQRSDRLGGLDEPSISSEARGLSGLAKPTTSSEAIKSDIHESYSMIDKNPEDIIS